MPTASYGFIAATSANPRVAGTRPSRGTVISASDITVSSTLSVSSGTRLSSSTYSSAAAAHRLQQRAVDEDVGPVALGEHQRRVEVPDQAGGRQLGVALDEHERHLVARGDLAEKGRLAGAGRPFEDDMRTAAQRRLEELGLLVPVDDLWGVTAHACSWTTTPRTFFPASRSS